MEVTIKGKRCEGKSTLAQIIARHLQGSGFIVSLTEFPGAWEKFESKAEPRNIPISSENLPNYPDQRNVDISVMQLTEELWDGKVVVDPGMKKAAERQRKMFPHFHGEDEGSP